MSLVVLMAIVFLWTVTLVVAYGFGYDDGRAAEADALVEGVNDDHQPQTLLFANSVQRATDISPKKRLSEKSIERAPL